ncbi:MAG: hypoxanthine phosphoribosyltransferase [Fusobacterium sp.]|nr:hypoxanthine phosphoribosyltransferase [Fusobacterium sp.]
MNYSIEILISREEVEARIKELANKIEQDYKNKDLVCVGLLKGSVMFLSDLIKEINLHLQIDFMNVSSYGNETTTSGNVKILKDTDIDVSGKDVLIVEDIIDTGITLEYVLAMFKSKGVASVKTCSLLSKPERRKVEVPVDYIGFEVPDKFVVGYGLDYAQKHRNLPYIGAVVFQK